MVWWVIVGLAVVHVTYIAIYPVGDFAAFGDGPARWINLDSEQSLGTWFTVVLLVAIGFEALRLAEAAPASPARWSVVAAVALAASIEEVIGLHEWAASQTSSNDLTWLKHSGYLSVAAAAALVTFVWSRSVGGGLGRVVLLGVVVYGAAAAGVEALEDRTDGVMRSVTQGAQEVGELIGAAIVFAALHGHRKRLSTRSPVEEADRA